MPSDQPTSPMPAEPAPVRGVLFDIDDTLFDYSSSERSGLLAHLAALGLLDHGAEHEELVAVWRRFVDEEHERFLAGEQTFTDQQLSRTRRFLAHLGRLPDGGISDSEAAAWFAGYVSHRNASWAAFPDAAPLLELLAADYRLGVISNSSREHQLHKLEHIGLLTYFGDAIVCSESHGAAKPHPSIFRAGCALLDLPPHEVAYVGDKYAVDAVGARDAGLRAYWLDRTGASADVASEYDIQVITSLAELPALLRLPAVDRG
ncbi:putative hydrolase of the HAD superfamily [Actinopolymorpha cephalotaxi]|uniref:Hydrolase of the HAD superfamily n=1 Tax=Actinopolymorpha cephalotaxi TaxID=504797 RepID=A0A1I2SBS9_9ACTN|nr:HAD family hydrolase [Actinopolymorpha cephalotaxi]NYH87093.1 putative hydrolase of the HAD superfamily [Actinopolymorpha cephalotaxi]SFG48387.1 putative hydrolase of the HAD superfamily [Actinopolymorpha cephalotaxi]